MSEFGSNNSKYNDMNEFKWTVLTKEEDIDGEQFEHQRQRQLLFPQNSSPYIQTSAKNFVQEFNFYSSLTSDSDLSLNVENYNLTQINGSELLFDKTNSSTFQIYYFYKTETLIFLWVLLALILLGNCTVLITLLRSKNRKTRMNFFIMHLAIADLTVGLVSVAIDIVWKTTVDFYGGDITCKAVRYSQQLVTYSSTYVLVSLSIDRYDAITHPLNFSGSWKRAKLLVLTAWTLSAIFSLPAIFLNEEAIQQGRPQCWIELEDWQWKIYISLVALSLFFFPAIIISGCYLIIVHTIWSKSKTIALPKTNKSKSKSNKANTDPHNKRQTNNSNDCQKYSDNDNDFKRASSRGIIPKAKIKTVKMTFVIVFVFILCWSPFFVWDLLQVWGAIPVSQTTIAISTFIQSLAPLNSAANPLIYFLFSTHFCRNIRRFSIFRIFCKKDRQNHQINSRRLDYNTINSTATHSSHSSARTQRFSMTSKSSPKSSKSSPSVRKTLVIRDVNRTQIQQDSNEPKLIDCSNSVV